MDCVVGATCIHGQLGRNAIVVAFIFLVGFLSSCSQNNLCVEPQLVRLRGSFVQPDTGLIYKDTNLVNANIYFGTNQSYVQQLKKSNRIAIALSQTDDSSMLIFQSDSSLVSPESIDTVVVRYTRSLNFISSACGYQTFFTLDSIQFTKHVLDSVYISTTEITSDINKTHLQFVLQP